MKIKTVKTKEKLIYEFVDEVIDHGFKANQEVVNHETIKIDMVFEGEIEEK